MSDTPTIPSHALGCECDLCEDMPRFSKQAESLACKAARISPLARAALDNGVSFEDVQAYCGAAPRTTALVYEALLLDDAELKADYMSADGSLDTALARSFRAQADGSVAAARLWWRGVLP